MGGTDPIDVYARWPVPLQFALPVLGGLAACWAACFAVGAVAGVLRTLVELPVSLLWGWKPQPAGTVADEPDEPDDEDDG